MVEGAIEFYKSGDFELSNIIEEKTKEVIIEFNPLINFLSIFNNTSQCKRKHIWQLYCQFFTNKEDRIYKKQKDLIDALCNSNWNISKPNTHYLQGISINYNNEWVKSHLIFNDNGKASLLNDNLQFNNYIEE